MTNKRNRQAEPIPLDQIGVQLLSKLIANLLDENDNHIKALPYDVSRLELGEQYTQYQHALSIIEDLYPLPCSVDMLTTALKLRGVDRADELVTAIHASRTHRADTDPLRVVRTSVIQFEEWYRRISKITRLERALTLARSPGGLTPAQEDKAINEELTQIIPLATRVEVMDLEERHAYWLDQQHAAAERAKNGKAAVPLWPWETLNLHVSGLQKGDPALFAAQTKFGKTTIGDVCAEYWAWQQGYYVCVIALETMFESYERRFIARYAGIPTRFFAAAQRVMLNQYTEITVGPIDPLDDYWRPHIGPDFTKRIIEKYNTGGGYIQHRRIKGGGDGNQVANIMRDFTLNVAEPAGREAVFVIDYLQAMDYADNIDERIGLTRNTNAIKNAFDALGVYGVLLSQEHTEDPDKGVEKAKSRRTNAFGSSMPTMRTQQYLSFQRPIAKADEPVANKNGQRLYFNALGEQRFFAHKDSPSGLNAQIVISYANEGQQGASAQVLFEGELFNVLCPEKVLRGAKNRDEWGRLPDYPMLVDEHYNQAEIDGLSLSG